MARDIVKTVDSQTSVSTLRDMSLLSSGAPRSLRTDHPPGFHRPWEQLHTIDDVSVRSQAHSPQAATLQGVHVTPRDGLERTAPPRAGPRPRRESEVVAIFDRNGTRSGESSPQTPGSRWLVPHTCASRSWGRVAVLALAPLLLVGGVALAIMGGRAIAMQTAWTTRNYQEATCHMSGSTTPGQYSVDGQTFYCCDFKAVAQPKKGGQAVALNLQREGCNVDPSAACSPWNTQASGFSWDCWINTSLKQSDMFQCQVTQLGDGTYAEHPSCNALTDEDYRTLSSRAKNNTSRRDGILMLAWGVIISFLMVCSLGWLLFVPHDFLRGQQKRSDTLC